MRVLGKGGPRKEKGLKKEFKKGRGGKSKGEESGSEIEKEETFQGEKKFRNRGKRLREKVNKKKGKGGSTTKGVFFWKNSIKKGSSSGKVSLDPNVGLSKGRGVEEETTERTLWSEDR